MTKKGAPGSTGCHEDGAKNGGGKRLVRYHADLPASNNKSKLPELIRHVGNAGKNAWEEYFDAKLQNKHTKTAYLRAVRRFLVWVERFAADETLGDISRITPGIMGRYFGQLELSTPSKKLQLAAIRGFFDVLVERHIVVINPAMSVRTERFSSLEGKTPEISVDQARKLLESIETETVVGLRDKAVLATLVYTAARAGAVARLRLSDFVDDGTQYVLKFQEKRGQSRQIPVRHDLQNLLLEYVNASTTSRISKDVPLFRTAIRRNGPLSDVAMNGIDICRMMKRRLKNAGLPLLASPHSFRSCAATDLLLQGVSLEDVQYLLGHADVRVTRLYDRRQRRVTRNIVERISV